MKGLQKILVSIDTGEHAGFVVEKALKLRDYADADLIFVQPLYDEVLEDVQMHFSDEERDQIIRLLVEAEEIKFEHLVGSVAADGNWQSTVEWRKRRWEGIIETAQRYGCDLIIKDAFVETSLNVVVHTPHDWNLLRHSAIPLMMIKPQPWVERSNIVAAIDVADTRKHEINNHVLRYASSLAELLGGKLHVANALPSLKENVMERASFRAYEKMKLEVEASRYDYMQRLVKENGVNCEAIHIVGGIASIAINDLVEELHAEFLVIGKIRPGVASFLGTTAELLLHSVNSDVVSIA